MADKKIERAKAQKIDKKSFGDLLSNVDDNLGKSGKRKISKEITKKTNRNLVIAIVSFLLIGVILGFVLLGIFTKNDCFEMNKIGNDIDIYIGEQSLVQNYTEKGAKCVVFGKDISNSVKVKYQYREDISFEPVDVNSVDINKAGIYYAIYTVDNFMYSRVVLTRNIIVLRSED